ncbi:MAG: DEAD/DEAH box helicase family protein, partial [Bacteroidales bacterium]|nr:DEAD/DEAH box helicase family protein [Bacteroidales bacterium]
MQNFDYLQSVSELSDLYRFCHAAEMTQLSDPENSAINSRKALEWMARAIYAIKGIELGDKESLFEMVDGEPFKEFVGNDKLMMAVHYIRKVGNAAAHSGKVSKKESFFALLNLYNFVGGAFLKLGVLKSLAPFDRTLIPTTAPIYAQPPQQVQPSMQFVSTVDSAQVSPAPIADATSCLSEAETRKLYIDLMLREAGWNVLDEKGKVLPSTACVEVEVFGMSNTHEKGYADYVLFGQNGVPLAVVEAKRTSVSATAGKHQAELYADCLEKQYKVRPVIYYTNGFETYIIDGLGYPPRRLYAFHTEKDLMLLIARRKRGKITDFKIKNSITDRDYQKTAIKAVCEHLNEMHRRALLVMATGTGKTRVAISLVDVLMRNEWVKNVLFLADRTSLVRQAHKNFVKLMPNTTTCVLSE